MDDSACQSCSASELLLAMCWSIGVVCYHDVVINSSETKRRKSMSVITREKRFGNKKKRKNCLFCDRNVIENRAGVKAY
jgi:hypothetical protein